ncbi:hypothetical protein L6164_003018 [Bauhinia variegata]|uniref:Uncharacterized protein n=1 Tax=Bauhinia variegata TaxID=167791 RepID=A0ACB9PZ52_BAUVA|nr:hypothetical protein L6164_003018 [Bauhinia variegata]
MIAREVGNTVDENGFVPVISACARCVKGDIDAAWESLKEAKRPRPLKLLAGLAAIHVEDDESDDNIQTILFSAFLGSEDEKESKGLDSSNWEKVPPFRTLIKPIECKELWEAFRVEAKDAVNSAPQSIQLEFPDISSPQHIKAEEAGYKDKTFKREDNGKRKITTTSVRLNDEKGNDMNDSKPAHPIHIPVSPSTPVSTCPKIIELKSSMTTSIPSEAPDMLSLQHIKVEERGGIKKTSKREEKGKMDKEKSSSVGMAGSDAFFLPSSPGLELTTRSQSLRTYPHSFGYPFNTFSSPLNGALRLILTKLISLMSIQNLECAHLFSRLYKIEKSSKVKTEMETKIDRPHDELEDVLPYKKVGSVQKLKSYVEVLEFGFWNGVKQVANQAKLKFPEFEIDKTKLDMFKGLHNGQIIEPRKATEEEIDVKLI